MSFRISLSKDQFKFSAAHMTYFSKSEAERLHGHNYYVSAEIHFSQLNTDTEMAAEFHQLKAGFKKVCLELDEYILIAENSPWHKLEKEATSVSLQFADKLYRFPLEDVCFLPLANITSEGLAQYLCKKLKTTWRDIPDIQSVEVNVQETRGQSVSYKETWEQNS